jgi:hypothetical protein
MKYTHAIIIKKSIVQVIEKFDSTDNMKHWQFGLISIEHISGRPGELGAKMKLTYVFGKRNMELIETITKRNLPHEFNANYSTKGILNIQQNFFESTAEGYTRWKSYCEYSPTTLIMNLMLFLMPRSFKKQSLQYMTNFKNFVEHGTSVANA